MNRFMRWAMIFILGLVLFYAIGALHSVNAKAGGNRIAVIKIDGAIFDSEETIRQIRRYTGHKDTVALILRINSPGGAVAPTQEIYQEVLKQREGGIVVVTSMGSVAASGGYYIASASDYIVANPGTITGSIGVIMAFPSVEKLMEKVGISAEVVKSGKFKDMGSPLKHLSDEERKFLQALIDDVYQQFLDAVAEGRGLDKKELKAIANGGIYSGRQALGLGLVDRLGNLDDAIEEAAKLAEIDGEPKVIMGSTPRGLWYRFFRGSYVEELKDKIGGLYPSLQYIWGY